MINFHPEKTDRDNITAEQLAAHNRCANYIRDKLGNAGIETFEVVSSVTGEKSIVGIIGEINDLLGDALIFDCHYDVKDVEGRKAEENFDSDLVFIGERFSGLTQNKIFNLSERGIAKVYRGAGSCDMLGSSAALLATVDAIKDSQKNNSNSCIFIFAPDEEFGAHHGTELAVQELYNRYTNLQRKTSEGKVHTLIMEPTYLAYNRCHRGQIVMDVKLPSIPPSDLQGFDYQDFSSITMHPGYFDKNSESNKPVLKQVLDYLEENEGKIFPIDLFVGDKKGDEIVISNPNAIPTCARLYFTNDKSSIREETSRLIDFLKKYWDLNFIVPKKFPRSKFATEGISYGINIKRGEDGWMVFLNIRMFYENENEIKEKLEEIVKYCEGNITRFRWVKPLHTPQPIPLLQKLVSHGKRHWPVAQNLFSDNYDKATSEEEFLGGTVARWYKQKGVNNIVIWGPLGFLLHAKGEFVFVQSIDYMALVLQDLLESHLRKQYVLPLLPKRHDATDQSL
ncbi:MAG: M20/M25/M40 family metallo-hydrolase [Candidatus Omnitrophica bacterium]|nr:M20/M25/M40 family metallo-hydrolase [Candidatus Omnitrophota bacterium]